MEAFEVLVNRTRVIGQEGRIELRLAREDVAILADLPARDETFRPRAEQLMARLCGKISRAKMARLGQSLHRDSDPWGETGRFVTEARDAVADCERDVVEFEALSESLGRQTLELGPRIRLAEAIVMLACKVAPGDLDDLRQAFHEALRRSPDARGFLGI